MGYWSFNYETDSQGRHLYKSTVWLSNLVGVYQDLRTVEQARLGAIKTTNWASGKLNQSPVTRGEPHLMVNHSVLGNDVFIRDAVDYLRQQIGATAFDWQHVGADSKSTSGCSYLVLHELRCAIGHVHEEVVAKEWRYDGSFTLAADWATVSLTKDVELAHNCTKGPGRKLALYTCALDANWAESLSGDDPSYDYSGIVGSSNKGQIIDWVQTYDPFEAEYVGAGLMWANATQTVSITRNRTVNTYFYGHEEGSGTSPSSNPVPATEEGPGEVSLGFTCLWAGSDSVPASLAEILAQPEDTSPRYSFLSPSGNPLEVDVEEDDYAGDPDWVSGAFTGACSPVGSQNYRVFDYGGAYSAHFSATGVLRRHVYFDEIKLPAVGEGEKWYEEI